MSCEKICVLASEFKVTGSRDLNNDLCYYIPGELG